MKESAAWMDRLDFRDTVHEPDEECRSENGHEENVVGVHPTRIPNCELQVTDVVGLSRHVDWPRIRQAVLRRNARPDVADRRGLHESRQSFARILHGLID